MNGPFEIFKWQALFSEFDVFLDGFFTTLLVALLGLIVALVLGVIFGILSTSKLKLFKSISRIYVELIQNTPLVIQIFFLYNGVPYINIILPAFVIGFLGVGIYHGAYISEVVRAGIESIPTGQYEASRSQGFSHIKTMIYVILPQTIKIVLPPLTNQLVNLIKNTSVLAMIAGGDLMYNADSWSSGNMYYGPAYIVTGALYFILCYPLANFARRLEIKNKNQIEPNKTATKTQFVIEGGA